VAGQELVEHYEQLRLQRSESGREGMGLALLMHQGMHAWMQAWARCTTLVEPQSSCSSGSEGRGCLARGGEAMDGFTRSVQIDVVRILVNMALKGGLHEKN